MQTLYSVTITWQSLSKEQLDYNTLSSALSLKVINLVNSRWIFNELDFFLLCKTPIENELHVCVTDCFTYIRYAAILLSSLSARNTPVHQRADKTLKRSVKTLSSISKNLPKTKVNTHKTEHIHSYFMSPEIESI